MKFKTKRDCNLWCDTNNELPIRIEVVIARHCAKLRNTGDPRLHALGRSIWKLVSHCRTEIRHAQDEIKARESEFVDVK